MSVNEKMTAIADAIRGHTTITKKLSLDEMPSGINEVYNDGYNVGYTLGGQAEYGRGKAEGIEEGKQAEYDAFWDVLQNYGDENGVNYYYKFSYSGWTDDNFNPKYPLICKLGTTAGMALFYSNEVITDTKVPIIVKGASAQSMFATSTKLKKIRELNVNPNVAFSSTFVNCAALVELKVTGTIGKNGFDVHYSKLLNKASIESIINALSATESGLTVTFSKTAVNKAFETAEGLGDGSTSDAWKNLIATKSNWTISLA